MKRLIIYLALMTLFAIGSFKIYKQMIRPEQMVKSWRSEAYYLEASKKLSDQPIIPNGILCLGTSITVESGLAEAGIPGLQSLAMRGAFTHELEIWIVEVLKRKPSMVVLEMGVNDIFAGFEIIPTVNRISLFLEEVERKLPESKIVIISLTPVNVEDGIFADSDAFNVQIGLINSSLNEMSQQKNWDFVDVNTLLVSGQSLDEALTYDGVHLNERGNSIWRKKVEEAIELL